MTSETSPVAPGLTSDEIDFVQIAKGMRERLEERAAITDAERRLPEETIAEFADSGLFKMVVPKRYGGYGRSLAEWFEVQVELARACPSSAWVQSILGGTAATTLVIFGDEARMEVLESASSPLVCGVFSPTGVARAVEGGYLVNGSFGFASGSLHAHWAIGGNTLVNAEGSVVDRAIALMPMEDVRIKDTWHVVGMRGTGSNTLVAQDVFVPEHRVVLGSSLDKMPFWGRDKEPAERWDLGAAMGLVFPGPSLGAAEAIFDRVSDGIHGRGITFYSFERQSDSHVVLEQIGEARMILDSAWLHMQRGISLLEEITLERPLTTVERARCRADGAFAVHQIRAAVDRLLGIPGASVYAESNPIQRYWRDLSFATRHANLNTRPALEAYGRALTGVPNITQFV